MHILVLSLSLSLSLSLYYILYTRLLRGRATVTVGLSDERHRVRMGAVRSWDPFEACKQTYPMCATLSP
jgi:hypothetical protein